MTHWGLEPSCPLPLPSYPHGGTPNPHLALPRHIQELICRAAQRELYTAHALKTSWLLGFWSSGSGDDMIHVCSHVFTGTQALTFPCLTLILSLFTRNDYNYFCGESQESQVWGGSREEVPILLQHTRPLPGPGDPTLKGVSVKQEPPKYPIPHFRKLPCG